MLHKIGPGYPSIARRARSSAVAQKLIVNFVLLASIWVFLAISTQRFLSVQNLTDVFRQVSVVAIVASIVTLLMQSLNFDLSVGGVLALSGCIAASLTSQGWPIPLAFAVGMLVGGAVGVTNGFFVLAVGINSVIATLGMMFLTRGAAFLTTNGVSLYISQENYNEIGAGYLGGIPIPVVIMVVVVAAAEVVSRTTLIGKYARATGSNLDSARLAGVPTNRVRLVLFVLTGLAAGSAGILVSSRLSGGYPTVGVGFELQVIVAAVLGGTSLSGGEGSVVGTFLGAVIIGSLNNGLDLLQVPTFWQNVVLGLVLLIALGADALLARRRGDASASLSREGRSVGPEIPDEVGSSPGPSRDERRDLVMAKSIVLAMSDISKDFGGVHALTDASFEVRAGEVHALLGENGAGKSTLVKIIAGALEPDRGTLQWGGDPVQIRSFKEADRLGIRIIYQHPNVLDHLTVAENIALGRERTHLTFIDAAEQRRRAEDALATLGVELPADALAGNLRVAEKQIIEIARALWGDVRLLIMDEPTASLGDRETERLFAVTRRLCRRGVGVVFISHKLDEVLSIADRTTVLRNGQTVGTVARRETTPEQLITMMVGRRLGHSVQRVSHAGDSVLLRVESLSTDTGLTGISFELREGEVLGVYGLLGSGRTELTRALFGADPIREGTITVHGQQLRLRSTAHAKRRGLGLVPEERSRASFPFLSTRENITAASVAMIAPRGWLKLKRERSLSRKIVDELNIVTPSIETPLNSLSGGNQQKVIVGRWLVRDVPILVMDDPTSGIDVGAKDDLYRLIGEMTARHTSIIMTSSELPELLALSDRLMVLHRGRLVGILDRDAMARETAMRMAVAAGDRHQVSAAALLDAVKGESR
jgi:ribose transport system ATP-binding protein